MKATFASISIVVLMVLTFTSGLKIPKAIKKLNKALGFPKDSEAFWNVIDIAKNTADISMNTGLISDNGEQDAINTAYIKANDERIKSVGLTGSIWFDAFRTSSQPASDWTTVTYDDLRSSPGSTMNAHSGRFVCYTKGTYEFIFAAQKVRNEEGMVSLLKNGSQQKLNHLSFTDMTDMLYMSMILDLTYGDEVWVETKYTLFSLTPARIWFSGHLLKALESRGGFWDVEDGPYGGSGGISWSDIMYSSMGHLTAVELRSKSYGVVAIRARYGDSVWGQWHGGSGGSFHSFEINNGSVINKVQGREGQLIDEIEFIGDDDNVYGPYGGSGGVSWVSYQPGCKLLYLSGRCGSLLDSITLHYDCPPTKVMEYLVDEE